MVSLIDKNFDYYVDHVIVNGHMCYKSGVFNEEKMGQLVEFDNH